MIGWIVLLFIIFFVIWAETPMKPSKGYDSDKWCDDHCEAQPCVTCEEMMRGRM